MTRLLLTLTLALALGGCSIFFDPNSHLAGGGGSDAGSDGGAVDGSPDAPVDGGELDADASGDGGLPACPTAVGTRNTVVDSSVPATASGDWATLGQNLDGLALVELMPAASGGTPLVDVDIMTDASRLVAGFLSAATGANPTVNAVAYDYSPSVGFDARSASTVDGIASTDSARWIAFASGGGRLEVLVAGESVSDSGVWSVATDSTAAPASWDSLASRSGAGPTWGRVAFTETHMVVVKPAGSGDTCIPDGVALQSIRRDMMDVPVEIAFPMLGTADGAELDGSRGPMLVASRTDEAVYIWDGVAPDAFDLSTPGRSGPAAIAYMGDNDYLLAFAVADDIALWWMTCDTDGSEVQCDKSFDNSRGAGMAGRVALAGFDGGAVLVFENTVGMPGTHELEVQAIDARGGDLIASARVPLADEAAAVLDLAVDIHFPTVGIVWTEGSPGSMTADTVQMAALAAQSMP